MAYLVICVSFRLQAGMCLSRMSKGDIYIKKNFQRSRSAVWPQLEWKATPVSARGPLPLCLCPAGRAEPLNPPTLTQPPPPRSRPVQLSHAWPSLGIYSGCFLFYAFTPLSHSFFFLSICRPLHFFLSSLCRLTHFHFVPLRKNSNFL